MKKSCKNINITNPDTIRPYVEECLSRHKKKRKFRKLVSYKGYFKYSDCRKLRKEMKLKSAFEQAQQTIGDHERSKRNESIL